MVSVKDAGNATDLPAGIFFTPDRRSQSERRGECRRFLEAEAEAGNTSAVMILDHRQPGLGGFAILIGIARSFFKDGGYVTYVPTYAPSFRHAIHKNDRVVEPRSAGAGIRASLVSISPFILSATSAIPFRHFRHQSPGCCVIMNIRKTLNPVPKWVPGFSALFRHPFPPLPPLPPRPCVYST